MLKTLLYNEFFILILLFLGIFYLNKFIIKLRANKLLKIIYRLYYFEKKEVLFFFEQTQNNEVSQKLWGRNLSENFKYENESIYNNNNENITCLYFHKSFKNNLEFTYNEFLILSKKFNEYLENVTHYKIKKNRF